MTYPESSENANKLKYEPRESCDVSSLSELLILAFLEAQLDVKSRHLTPISVKVDWECSYRLSCGNNHHHNIFSQYDSPSKTMKNVFYFI